MQKITTSRRGFMQLSATSAAFLAAGASFASLTGCTKAPVASGYKVLRNTDFEFITAIAPVVLGGSYPGVLGPEKAPEVLLKAVDNLVVTLQEYAQSQLIMMFDVMQSAPLRVAMDAPWSTWSEATAEDIERFLQGWKTSMIPLKRMGYGSLVKVLTMCWYSQPETFISSGYPGMPKRELLTDQPIAAAD